jgi:hypothetical protein
MTTQPKTRKLVLNKESIRRLDAQEQQAMAGGAAPTGGLPPLTFTMACYTSNCLTLGEFCPTHDCTLTFGACTGW